MTLAKPKDPRPPRGSRLTFRPCRRMLLRSFASRFRSNSSLYLNTSLTASYRSLTTSMRDTTQQLKELRRLLKEEKVDAYVVDSGDNHASEYVADSDKRRGKPPFCRRFLVLGMGELTARGCGRAAWLSGFTGSAGESWFESYKSRSTTADPFIGS